MTYLSSGMTSVMLAEAVEVVDGVLISLVEQWQEAVLHMQS